MNGSVNKVILIGNLGKDPEVRRLENGAMVATFPLATSEVYIDKQTGEKREVTDWHDIVLWRGLAEIAEKYVRKGSKIYVEGKLKKRSWTDKEGNQRFNVEVVGEDFTILSKLEANEQKPPYTNENRGTNLSPISGLKEESDDESPF
jgi:single-strand DNA-binding protein